MKERLEGGGSPVSEDLEDVMVDMIEIVEEIPLDDDQEMPEDDDDDDREKPEDLAVITFNNHHGMVFSCDLHPSGKFAVTGGEDDKAYVWSVETGEIITECSDHKDSVFFVGFSFDGTYLATSDMSGLVQARKCKLGEDCREQWPLDFEYVTGDLVWGFWHFGARVLLLGAEDGDIYVFKIPSGETKILNGHSLKTECGKVFPDGIRLAAGYVDGSVRIWDLKTNAMLHQVSNSFHMNPIMGIDIHPENSLVASISALGKLVLVTANNGKVVAQLDVAEDLEVVSFAPDAKLGNVALGTLKGSVTLWDTARKMIRHHCAKEDDEFPAGVTKMIWVNDQLVTSCLDGTLRIYDARSGELKFGLTGHLSSIMDFAYNKEANIFLTTSDDSTARIFKYPEENEAME